ncbi:MAG: hypothetical protein JO011_01690 [Ktedonobacteraceae bacterium]|nr:hypothetical protein [Ktedonobacteraceae bacterium]
MFSFTCRQQLVNAIRSEQILPFERAVCPNHEQHSYWQQIKLLHKRTFAHHFCKFGTEKTGKLKTPLAPTILAREAIL